MRFVKETLKTFVLAILILSGLFFWQTFDLSNESTPAKAKRIQERGGNIRLELTREERDEYMDYLQALSGYTFENGTTNDPIFTIEVP